MATKYRVMFNPGEDFFRVAWETIDGYPVMSNPDHYPMEIRKGLTSKSDAQRFIDSQCLPGSPRSRDYFIESYDEEKEVTSG